MFPLEPAGVTVKVYVVPLPDNAPAVPPLTATSPIAKSATASEKVNVNTTGPVAVPDVLSVMVSVGANRSRVAKRAPIIVSVALPWVKVDWTLNETGPWPRDLISAFESVTLHARAAMLMPVFDTVPVLESTVREAVPLANELIPETTKPDPISAAEIMSSVATTETLIVSF